MAKRNISIDAILSIVLGFVGIILWIIPLAGIAVSSLGLTFGMRGVETQKKTASIGIIFSGAGLILGISMGLMTAYQVLEENLLSDKAYLDYEAGFSIYPPRGWEAGKEPGIAVFFSEKRTGASINIVSDHSTEITLEEYAEAIKEELYRTLDSYTIIREEGLMGKEAKIIEGHFFYEGASIRNIQLITKTEDSAFIITGTAPESSWDKYRDLIRDSILTFNLL